MKKLLFIFISFSMLWGCGGGDSDSSPEPSLSPSITWSFSSSSSAAENAMWSEFIDVKLNNSTSSLNLSLTGTDADDFSISNGYLVFNNTPDYENPSDADTDNSYSFTINASGAGLS